MYCVKIIFIEELADLFKSRVIETQPHTSSRGLIERDRELIGANDYIGEYTEK